MLVKCWLSAITDLIIIIMEIILSKQCEALTGSLGRGFGYAIQKRTDHNGKTRFWGVRYSNRAVPPDGHLRFIFTCADLAQMGLHISDISVSAKELREAFEEADLWYGVRIKNANGKQIFNASDIIKIRRSYLPDMV